MDGWMVDGWILYGLHVNCCRAVGFATPLCAAIGFSSVLSWRTQGSVQTVGPPFCRLLALSQSRPV